MEERVPKVHVVKVELAKRGESQRACAISVGVSPPVLTQVLNGHRSAWPALRRRLADHLGKDETELFAPAEAQSCL
jgi:transcriptional regulator with XRE-family HTH domain